MAETIGSLRGVVQLAFPKARFLFENNGGEQLVLGFGVLDPDFVVCDEKNLYVVLKYRDLVPEKIRAVGYRGGIALKEDFDWWSTPDGFELRCGILDYYNSCASKCGEDVAKCVLNLFFDIGGRFNVFHTTGQNSIKDQSFHSQPRLYYCAILCEKNQREIIKKTLELFYSIHVFEEGFEHYVKTIDLKEHTLFLLNIAVIYHLTDCRWFAYKTGAIFSLPITKGNIKRDVLLGNPLANASPKNLYNPDNMTPEAKKRWGKL